MHFMIPNLKTQMSYNGYVWTHESDAYGFRNRRTAIPADIVLLGSYIYGHGVDFEFTVGHFLEQRTGLSVANLARQGTAASSKPISSRSTSGSSSRVSSSTCSR